MHLNGEELGLHNLAEWLVSRVLQLLLCFTALTVVLYRVSCLDLKYQNRGVILIARCGSYLVLANENN